MAEDGSRQVHRRGRRSWVRVGMVALALACVVPRAGAQPRPQRSPLEGRPQETTPQAPTASPEQPVPTESDIGVRARYMSPELFEATVDPARYVLGPGDILGFMLLVGETRTEQLPVLPEGVVVIPNVGAVEAAGKSLDEFRTALRSAVSRRYRDYELYCYLVRPRQFRIYVTGEVATPGFLAARAMERVSDVIDRAGGFTPQASRRDIEVLDGDGRQIATVDLVRFLARGDMAANPNVRGGEVVRVPPLGRQASIVGEVNDPGLLEVRSGETVNELLELAGGLTATADLSQVAIERTDASGTVTLRTMDLRTESPLADDVTRVTVASKQLGHRRAFFIAPDDRQQTFYIGENETLSSLVRRIANLPPDADLAEAELATHDDEGRPVQIPVNLTRVLSGEQDYPLKDGDVLSVPSIRGYVYVSGFVSRPGRYAYRAEWIVNDYLGEAGGPALGGSRDRVTVLATDGSKRKADRRSPVQRGETVYVDRSLGSKSASALGVLINVTALALSVVALTR